MKRTNSASAIGGVALIVFSGALWAEAQGIKLGPGARLYTGFGASALYDSNFFFANDGQAEEGVLGVLFRPSVSVVRTGSKAKLQAGARGEIANFDNGEQDDYFDGDVFGQFDYIATSRHRFNTRVERNYGHDPFGRVRTEGTQFANRELDEWHEDGAGISYRFGAPDALINLQYGFGYLSKEYDTNREDGTRFLDFDRTGHTGTLFFKYSPKTSLLFQASTADIEFPSQRPGFLPRDAREYRGRIGAEWKATARTTGRVLVGVLHRDPDDDRRDDFTGSDWDVRIAWTPRRPTTFIFNTGRETRESFLLDSSFINSQEVGVTWRQRWTSRFNSGFSTSYLDQDFEDVGRQDDFLRFDLDLSYTVDRQVAVFLGAGYDDRDSNVNARDFSKETVSIGVRYRR